MLVCTHLRRQYVVMIRLSGVFFKLPLPVPFPAPPLALVCPAPGPSARPTLQAGQSAPQEENGSPFPNGFPKGDPDCAALSLRPRFVRPDGRASFFSCSCPYYATVGLNHLRLFPLSSWTGRFRFRRIVWIAVSLPCLRCLPDPLPLFDCRFCLLMPSMPRAFLIGFC